MEAHIELHTKLLQGALHHIHSYTVAMMKKYKSGISQKEWKWNSETNPFGTFSTREICRYPKLAFLKTTNGNKDREAKSRKHIPKI